MLYIFYYNFYYNFYNIKQKLIILFFSFLPASLPYRTSTPAGMCAGAGLLAQREGTAEGCIPCFFLRGRRQIKEYFFNKRQMTNWLVAPFGQEMYSVFESRLPYILIIIVNTGVMAEWLLRSTVNTHFRGSIPLDALKCIDSITKKKI